MSTVKVNTLTGTTTAGSIAVTGEGNSTTTNLQQGLAKFWVNFNGTGTVATRDSFNYTSLTDSAVGTYVLTIANNMSNANYAHAGDSGGTNSTTGGGVYSGDQVTARATTGYTIGAVHVVPSSNNDGTLVDCANIDNIVMGDLA